MGLRIKTPRPPEYYPDMEAPGGNAIADENLQNGDRVIVARPYQHYTQRVLLTSGGAFFAYSPFVRCFPACCRLF